MARPVSTWAARFSVILGLASPALAASFDLPFEVNCQGIRTFHSGAAVCAMPWGAPLKLRVKTPPTRGQLRVVDCDLELTNGGNPDDFNMVIEKTGFWLWQRRVIKLDDPPEFVFPLRNLNDCPVVISVAGEKAGVQSGILYVDHRAHKNPPELQDFLSYTCGGPILETERGLAACKGLEGSRMTFKVKSSPKSGTLLAVGTGCGITTKVDLSEGNSLEITLPNGNCIVDVGAVVAGQKMKSRFLVVGVDRTLRKIDTPIMVRDGKLRRIYRPQGANLGSTEIYLNEEVLWRSGVREDSSYVISPENDNADRHRGNKWPEGAIACNTAYAEDIDSVSGSCYDLNTMVEKPFFFR